MGLQVVGSGVGVTRFFAPGQDLRCSGLVESGCRQKMGDGENAPGRDLRHLTKGNMKCGKYKLGFRVQFPLPALVSRN